MRTYEELLTFIEEENVEFIRLAYFDVFGRQKNIAIMAGELERAMRARPVHSGYCALETDGRESLPHVLRYLLSGRNAV